MRTINETSEMPTWLFLLLNISMGSLIVQVFSALASAAFFANQLYIMKRRVDTQHEGSWKLYFQSFYSNNFKGLKKKK